MHAFHAPCRARLSLAQWARGHPGGKEKWSRSTFPWTKEISGGQHFLGRCRQEELLGNDMTSRHRFTFRTEWRPLSFWPNVFQLRSLPPRFTKSPETPVGIRGNTLPSGIFDIVGSTMREISRSFGLFLTLSALMFDRPKKKSTRLPNASTSGC